MNEATLITLVCIGGTAGALVFCCLTKGACHLFGYWLKPSLVDDDVIPMRNTGVNDIESPLPNVQVVVKNPDETKTKILNPLFDGSFESSRSESIS